MSYAKKPDFAVASTKFHRTQLATKAELDLQVGKLLVLISWPIRLPVWGLILALKFLTSSSPKLQIIVANTQSLKE